MILALPTITFMLSKPVLCHIILIVSVHFDQTTLMNKITNFTLLSIVLGHFLFSFALCNALFWGMVATHVSTSAIILSFIYWFKMSPKVLVFICHSLRWICERNLLIQSGMWPLLSCWQLGGTVSHSRPWMCEFNLLIWSGCDLDTAAGSIRMSVYQLTGIVRLHSNSV